MTLAKSEGPGKWAPGRGPLSHFAYQTAGAEGSWTLTEVEGHIPPPRPVGFTEWPRVRRRITEPLFITSSTKTPFFPALPSAGGGS